MYQILTFKGLLTLDEPLNNVILLVKLKSGDRTAGSKIN